MNELSSTPKLKSPLTLKGTAREIKELNDLLALNARATDPDLDPLTQQAIPAPVVQDALNTPHQREAGKPTVPAALEEPLLPEKMQAALDAIPKDSRRLFFTGRMMVGKDHCAAKAGARVESFAAPLYFLGEHFFGLGEKDKDQYRSFMQTAGQWGRGTISEKYPLTPERASFIAAVRSEAKRANFPDTLGVDWDAFGRDEHLWLNAALRRIEERDIEEPGQRTALTNVRFPNEYAALKNLGWQPWHVMVSPSTWAARLATKKLSPQSPEVHDDSEALAAGVDRKAFVAIRTKGGPRLRVIWSDERQPAPSVRFHNVDTFLASL